ncbi:g267 [Coccomyxa viridis]|uniref:G267 protein n=1 Tax=Coccomyxa viridis TaxID=1274662 RepID=A0ABP1FFA7_9CHLO
MILAPRWLRFLERVVLPVVIELMTPAPGWWQKIERALLQRVQQQMAPAYRWWQDVEQALRQPSTACLLLFLAGYVCAWQVKRHGLRLRLKSALIMALELVRGGTPKYSLSRERFEQVTKAILQLPMEEHVTREELQFCTLQELKEKLLQQGMSEEGLERGEALDRILGLDVGNSSCSVCQDMPGGLRIRRGAQAPALWAQLSHRVHRSLVPFMSGVLAA